MNGRQQIRMLPDGRRLHLQDGPIDLVIGAEGASDAVAAAHEAAIARFATLLDELCAELPFLRAPLVADAQAMGETSCRMVAAARPYAGETFITPMAAVAGAGADTILSAMLTAAPLARAYVNNGGDIALHLAPGNQYTIGMVNRPDAPSLFGNVVLRAEDGIHGIATSGRHGRSFSLGIADAVTVLAADAASADAAATLIANAVDLPHHPAIARQPANSLQPDNDLGARLVTRAVGLLSADEIARALDKGARYAHSLMERQLIQGVALHLAGETRLVGNFEDSLVVMPAPDLGMTPQTIPMKEWRNHAAG